MVTVFLYLSLVWLVCFDSNPSWCRISEHITSKPDDTVAAHPDKGGVKFRNSSMLEPYIPYIETLVFHPDERSI